ncbi:MAG: ketopantoate reductase family protein [Candidatus Thorarchaeota archaeon]
MKIVVIGPGAIGCAVAASISQENAEVFLLGRERHKEYFKKNPVIYKSYMGNLSSKIKAITVDDLKNGNLTPDALFITLKANPTLAFVQELQDTLPKETPIVSLQNGFVAQDIFDKTKFENVYPCVIGFNVLLEDEGVAVQTTDGDIIVGKLTAEMTPEKGREVPEFILKALNKIAPTSISENIISDVWMKVMINCTINPICAIGNFALGEIAGDVSGLTLALWTWKELVHVVDALGLKLNPFQGRLYPEMLYNYDLISFGIARTVVMRMTHENKDAIVSTLQDIRNNKTTEIDYLNGKVVELGKEYNVEMPINELLIDTIKKLEKGELKPSKGLIKKLYNQVVLS